MYLGENIRFLRRQAHLTQSDLSKAMGYRSFTTVQKWEEGTSQPPLEIMESLADYFGVDLKELISAKIYAGEAIKVKVNSVRIPIFSRLAADTPQDIAEDILGFEEIPAELAVTGDFFAFQVKGSSMAPRILENDVVIVKKQDAVRNNEIAIVIVGDTEATCKKVKQTADGLLLIPINPGYEPIFFTNKDAETLPIRIIGKAIELRGKL